MASTKKPALKGRAASKGRDDALEKQFVQALADFERKVTSGDPELDELVSDYVGLAAFDDGAGILGGSIELERQKALIMERLKKKPRT